MMADFGRLQLAQIPDFTVGGPDAGAMALDGFYAGQGNVRANQAMGLAQNADGRADVQLGMDQQRLVIDQQDAANRQSAFTQEQQDRVAQVTRAKEAQAAFGALYDKIDDGTATAADIAQITMAYPELSEGIKQTVDGMAQEQKATYTSLIYQAATALKLGKWEVAAKLFEDHAAAAENSGQTDAAAIARAMAETARADPSAALGTLGVFAQSIDPAINAALFGDEESPSDRFKVVGDQLVDLSGDGGPAAVDLGVAPQGPEWRVATPEEAAAYGAKAGQINTKTGKFDAATVPQGMTLVSDGRGGMTLTQGAIPDEKAAIVSDQKAGNTAVIVDAAAQARGLIGTTSTGILGQGMSRIASTDAAEIVRQVEVLQANAATANIQAMRDSSPTGAGMGPMTDKDIALVQAKAGALDPFSGRDRFARQLDDYERTLLRLIHGQAEGDKVFAATRAGSGGDVAGGPGSPVPVAEIPTQAEADALLREFGASP